MELAQDGIGVPAQIQAAAARGTQFGLDAMLFNGTGVGSCLGLYNQPSKISVARETAGTITYTDIAKMVARFYPGFARNAVFYANPDCFEALVKIKDENNNYVFQINASQGTPMRLFGFPLIFSEKVHSLANEGSLILVDPSKMFLGIRSDMNLETSNAVYWKQSLIAMRLLIRFDAQAALSTAITPRFGANTLSWLVMNA